MSRHHRRLSQRRLAVFRDAVLGRAGWKCQRCESPLDLEAHHETPIEAGGDPYDPANGTALCADCHADVHHRDPERLEWRRWVRYGEGITR